MQESTMKILFFFFQFYLRNNITAVFLFLSKLKLFHYLFFCLLKNFPLNFVGNVTVSHFIILFLSLVKFSFFEIG